MCGIAELWLKLNRYILDGNSKLQIHQEKNEHMANTLEEEEKEEANSSIPRAIKDFVLPAGFPGSVSDDYLEYMLWQLPTNVTGWICHTLVTSTLLKVYYNLNKLTKGSSLVLFGSR
jgi:hypothetical protein